MSTRVNQMWAVCSSLESNNTRLSAQLTSMKQAIADTQSQAAVTAVVPAAAASEYKIVHRLSDTQQEEVVPQLNGQLLGYPDVNLLRSPFLQGWIMNQTGIKVHDLRQSLVEGCNKRDMQEVRYLLWFHLLSKDVKVYHFVLHPKKGFVTAKACFVKFCV